MTTRADSGQDPTMKRRDFFKLGARKAAHVAYKTASARAAKRARNWIRPPFALDELDFLIVCTWCDQWYRGLPARCPVHAAGTPRH